MDKNYVVYHCHTDLSLLDSCTNYKLYIDKAVELGQKAICFTEHGVPYCWIKKKMYCEENNIKYLHGVEIYLTENLDQENKVRDNYHTILIAKNYDGFLELNKLIDISTQPDHFYYKNRITFDEFLNISDNIIKISACLASPLNRLSEESLYYEKLLKHYDYLEIQPHINSEEQKQFNLKLYNFSTKYNIPLICGTDTHSLNKYKAECRSILQKAKKIEYDTEDEFDLTYKSYEELVYMFEQQNSLPKEVYLEAIENTNVMADSVQDFELDLSFKYPKLYDNEEEVFYKLLEEKYEYKVNNGIIVGGEVYQKRIEEEIAVFKKIKMIGFMLFMSELLTWCRNNNIPYGFGRGSVSGSLVAYILDITDVDSIKWETVFSRFANEDRLEIGDIDLDFSGEQRELVYKYIIDRFTKEKTAFILAIGTISEKGTIDEIGRALDYSIPLVKTIKQEYDVNPEKAKEKYPELFYYFDGLINTAISQSIHPAGIVVAPLTLPDNYGTIWKDGERVLYINMDEVHEVSLVKYDILGLKNISIIKETCELVGIKYPLSHEVNWNDNKVWQEMLVSNIGIFQMESNFAHSLLKVYKPKSVHELCVLTASLRPSGESYRDKVINRQFNKSPSKEIEELLKKNNGFMIFQEDTIKFLQDICGLSGSEADNIRRAIGRKDEERLEKALPSILEGYCNKSNKPREVAEIEVKEFLDVLKSSAFYQFSLNHSVNYSLTTYICALLRHYYPLEFTTAYLNNANNQDDINDGTELARLKGISIKPVKFRYSMSNYYPDKNTNSIYKGINSIKGFGEKADIAGELAKLKNNEYSTFVDLLIDIHENTNVGHSKVELLITLNYFSEFGRNQKLLNIFNEFAKGKNKYDKKHTDKTKLARLPLLRQYEAEAEDVAIPIREQIKYENDLLGTPMSIYDLPKGTAYVMELETKNSPKMKLYGLSTGNIMDVKVMKKFYNKQPFEQGDIIQVLKLQKKQRVRFAGKDDNGKPKFEDVVGEFDIWIQDEYDKKRICYRKVNL